MANETKKILYIMSVPWGWIKQRPHFLAEGISDYYSVDVFYKKSTLVKSKNLLTEIPKDINNLKIKSFRIIPFYAIPLLRKLNLNILNTLSLFFQLPSLKQYDYIWIPSPKIFRIVAPLIPKNKKVIYDCMDDSAEFGSGSTNIKEKNRVLYNEKKLLERADYVICSAEYLKEKVLSRASLLDKPAIVVNNAIDIPKENEVLELSDELSNKLEFMSHLSKPLLYIGTIAEWFDFDTLINVLNNDSTLNLVLIGPDNISIPKHKQIHYLGTIKRDYVFLFMKNAYCLIMPFKINELIKSVNPVKLYEYIYSGKPVISVKYGETMQFAEFVKLYDSAEVLEEQIHSIDSNQYDSDYLQRCINFVKHNTWSNRCNNIIKYISNDE